MNFRHAATLVLAALRTQPVPAVALPLGGPPPNAPAIQSCAPATGCGSGIGSGASSCTASTVTDRGR